MTLFDLPPNVRLSDPDTSRAAALHDRQPLRDRVRAVLAAHPEGLTDWQITGELGLAPDDKPTVGKRRQEVGAVDAGERRPSPKGSPCIVWTLVAEGRLPLGADAYPGGPLDTTDVSEVGAA